MANAYPMCPPGSQMITAGAFNTGDFRCMKCGSGERLCAPTVYDAKCIPADDPCKSEDSVLKGSLFWILVAGIGAAAIYYFSDK